MATAEEVISAHIKLRDFIDETEKAQAAEVAPLKAKLKVMEDWLLAKLDADGLQNISVKGVGVAFKKKASSVTVGDWDATLTWIKQNEAWDYLPRSVVKTAVEAYIKQHQEPPPGVNYSAIFKLHVNRARGA